MSTPRGYNLLFGGATHRYICNCGKVFASKDPMEARKKYKKHKETCQGLGEDKP